MRRLTDLLRNLLGLDDGATTSLAQLENSTQRVRWRIGVGAALILAAAAIVITIVVSTISTLGVEVDTHLPTDLLAPTSASSQEPSGSPRDSLSPSVTGDDIFVHVVGAVLAPGLYAVHSHARVIDAVMAAGGLAELADPCSINLAEAISDGQQIVVPATAGGVAVNEAQCSAQSRSAQNSQPASSGVPVVQLSLASAGVAELDTLPGIGPALAQRIIDWRDATGGFTSIEQLSEVSGIGDKVMANIRDLVTL